MISMIFSGRLQRAMNSENMQFLFPKRVIWATVKVTEDSTEWDCVVRPDFCRKNWLVWTSYILRGLRFESAEARRCTWHMAGWKDRGYSYQQRLAEISANRWFDRCAIANVSSILSAWNYNFVIMLLHISHLRIYI